jgi:type VI secretion system secreted protein VgrG
MSITFTVQVGGLTLRDRMVSQLEVRQELGAHCTCALVFELDARRDLHLHELLGEPLSVKLGGAVWRAGSGEQAVFEGVVSGGAQSYGAHGGSEFSLEGISRSVRLEHRNTAVYKGTVVQVAEALGARVGGAPRGAPELEYVQYGETDFAFLLRVAEESGFFVRTSGAQPELLSEFGGEGAPLVWGQDLTAVTAVAHPVNHGFKGAFYQADLKHDSRLTDVRRTPAWLGGAPALVQKLERLAEDFGGPSAAHVEEFPARAATLEHFRAILEHKSERLLGSSVLVEGASTSTALTAGDAVELRNSGSAAHPFPIAGKFGLVRVTHQWDGERYANRFAATPWAGFTRLERPARRLAAGPVSAEVVQNEDPERLGRVRVRYPWQDRGTGENTRWVRVVAPHAGNGRGAMFLPEVGDEVLVAFEQGDPERPLVVGTLWNGKDLPPVPAAGNTAKRLVTRSGNTIQFLDDAGRETIELYSAQGTCFVQLANAVDGRPRVTVRSGGDLSLEAEGEIRMQCQTLTQRVSTDAGRYVGSNDVVKAGQNATVQAGQSLSLEGTNATLSAAATLVSKAGAVNNVAGAMVHIQPPGLASTPAHAAEPASPKSAWSAREVPRAAPGTTSGRSLRPGS